MEGSDIEVRWNSIDEIVFCLGMQAAEYNERHDKGRFSMNVDLYRGVRCSNAEF